MSGSMFIKLTFVLDYADLVLLVFAQLLRFIIWSLTLKNFMQSAASLVLDEKIQLTIKALKIAIYVGLVVYIAYGVLVVLAQELTNEDILDCHSQEFIIQNAVLGLILIVFIYYAFKVNKVINILLKNSSQHIESIGYS